MVFGVGFSRRLVRYLRSLRSLILRRRVGNDVMSIISRIKYIRAPCLNSIPQLTSQRSVRWQGGFEGRGGAIYNRGDIIVEGDAVFYENNSGVSRFNNIACRRPLFTHPCGIIIIESNLYVISIYLHLNSNFLHSI